MKKHFFIATLSLATLLTACGGTGHQEHNTDSAKTGKATKQYTCTMHADVIKDKPGTCPKCGMDLVEKEK